MDIFLYLKNLFLRKRKSIKTAAAKQNHIVEILLRSSTYKCKLFTKVCAIVNWQTWQYFFTERFPLIKYIQLAKMYWYKVFLATRSPHFFLRDVRGGETRVRVYYYITEEKWRLLVSKTICKILKMFTLFRTQTVLKDTFHGSPYSYFVFFFLKRKNSLDLCTYQC